jgi:hypothetical protein
MWRCRTRAAAGWPRPRLSEGVAGMARLHAMVAAQIGDTDPEQVQVLVGIETDRGPWDVFFTERPAAPRHRGSGSWGR